MRRVLFLVLALLAAAIAGVLSLGRPDIRPKPAVDEPTGRELLPAPAQAPKGLQGVWAARVGDCAPGQETRVAITADRMTFHEASGPILAAVPEPSGAVAFKVELTGEGVVRVVEHRFRLGEDDDTLTALDDSGGTVLSRRRCPP